VTESYGIQQFEYRWRPARDFSPVTGSRPMSDIEPWIGRIALWVRHRGADAPAESVRYEVFGDGMAALAWRHRNARMLQDDARMLQGDARMLQGDARMVEDETDSRPEATRLLMGPDHLLTPDVAVALCHSGLPPSIGPLPGQIAVGRRLPPVDPAELAELTRAMADDLDRLAAAEAGLDRVIAAALTDCDTPLSVQLPQRIIVMPPRAGSQGPLLWGLRRTVWPLLGSGAGRRGWSFSTYEPPLGQVDVGSLADIVFRAPQAASPGGMKREEILVRPHEPAGPSAAIRHQDFARLLVDAYRHLGGEKLVQHLDAVGGDYASIDKRIEAVQATLYSVLPATAISAPPRRPPREIPSPGPRDQAEDIGWPDDPAPMEGTAPRSPGRPSPVYPEEAGPPLRAPWPSGPPLSLAPRAGQDAPPLSPPAPPGPAAASGPEPPLSFPMTSLLDQLLAGPSDPDFEPALRLLWAGDFPDQPADRAAARQRMADRHWYLPVLLQYDLAHFDDTLEAIFRSAVIPDLDRPEVAQELASWAAERAAPPPVIKALNAAALGWAGRSELMRRILEPPLGSRWLTDHGIYTGPSAHDPSAYPGPSGPRRPGAHAAGRPGANEPSPEGRWHVDRETVLALICAVLLALLVLSLVH
jgi:hypothetical protein